MDKRMNTVRTVTAMFAAVILALLLAMTIYVYRTPKVYVAFAGKGIINGEMHDCIMPLSAVTEEGIVYIAAEKHTVLGTRYRVYEENVTITAEGDGMCAVDLHTDSRLMVVIAHDGNLKGNGDVLVYRS